jgi:type IV pilus assembly protein PilC
MIQNAIMARFSEVLSNLIAGGVNLIEAIEIARNSINNEYITESLERVKRQVYSGQPFAKSLRETGAFPETLCGFVEVGEETGKLNDMLNTISVFYEDEFDNSISQFSQMLEPIMIVFLGGVIGFILVAMYMPIFNMGSAVSG